MRFVTKITSALLVTSALSFGATLATVNGAKITDDEVNSVLMQATQGRFNQLPPAQQEQFKKRVLDQLIMQEIIYDNAKKQGITKSKEYKTEIDKALKRMKKSLAIQLWQKKVFDSIKVSNSELKSYYNKNKQEFKQKKAVHARHILVKTQKEAQDIIKQLKGLHGKALQKKFAELAQAKSIGPSGRKGGDLGFFSKGQMVPAFEKVAFSLKPGTITTTPVKTRFGYHVIYVEGKRDAQVRSFNEVKPYIEQRLKMEKFKKTMQKKLDALKAKAKIKR